MSDPIIVKIKGGKTTIVIENDATILADFVTYCLEMKHSSDTAMMAVLGSLPKGLSESLELARANGHKVTKENFRVWFVDLFAEYTKDRIQQGTTKRED